MCILKPFRRVVLACAAMLAMVSVVRATPVTSTFGPVAGTTITYSGSETDTQSPDPPSPTWLFGTPVISGSNNLHFTSDATQTPRPIQFAVITPGGEQLEDGKLAIDATSIGSNSIALMSITEGGDYLIANGTALSTADAILNITTATATVHVGPGNDVQIPLLPFITETFSQTSGSGPAIIEPTAIVFSGNGPLVTGTWQGTANFNVPAAVVAAGLAGDQVTKVEFTLDDILLGNAQSGAMVEITKKDFLLGPPNNTPEPSSIILGVLGGLSLAAVGYRKKFAKTA